ncbi:LacI family DNA-binding transcriptional regulator [Bifidobacterium subtile]|jgi:DNA-binding LacI/PurR family transcriptional regulator|uniref:LacI family DNA-binding transcriptional regulator n=1 Tax=Bifidobacterium subtile TaxID=77635 RepID=UPI002F35D638
MATLTDVARVAGVSKNTVSRYLNERGYMSKETKAAIQKAIDLLHYQPNQIARSLSMKKTNFIGLVIPDVIQPFFATMASHIEDELDRRGYKLILCNTMHSSSKERKYLDMLSANKVDGIIVGSHSVDIDYSGIDAPIVALDRWLADDIPVVYADHIQGGHIAARAFLEHGCRRVAQFVAYSKVSSPSAQRHKVFAEEMRDNGVECFTYELRLNQFEFTSYLQTADIFLRQYPDVDGVFASDLVALALQREALSRGRRVPDDLFLFGYDGSFVYKIAYPPLPTVIQPYDEMASAIVELLEERVAGHIPQAKSHVFPVVSSTEVDAKQGKSTSPSTANFGLLATPHS